MAKKGTNKVDNVNMFSVLDTSDDENEYISREIPVSNDHTSTQPTSNKHKGETKANNKKKQSTEQQSQPQSPSQQKTKKDTIKSFPSSSTSSATTPSNNNLTSKSTTNNNSGSSSGKNEDKVKLKKIENEIDNDLQSYYEQDANKSVTNQFLSMFVVILLIAIVIPCEKIIGYFPSRAIAVCLFFFLCFQIKEYVVPIFTNNSKNKIVSIIKKQQQLRNDKESLSNKLKSTTDSKEKKSIEDQIGKLKSEIKRLQNEFDRLDNQNQHQNHIKSH